MMSPAPWIEIVYRAGPEHAGSRVDVFLRAKMKRRSREEIQEWMAQGRVSRAGWPLKPSDRVRSQDEIFVRFERREDPPAQYDRLPVVYEDDWILAVNKPGKLLSHPTDKIKQNSVTEILAAGLDGLRPYLIHRLDRETSGILLLAKTKEAARALTEQFFSRTTKKIYLALVRGGVLWRAKIADAALARAGGEIWVRQEVARQGVPALTRFRRVSTGVETSLVAARPMTGRLHQIRAHLSWLGHPVLGDKLYQNGGGAYRKMTRGQITDEDLAALGAPRHMLHAWGLSLRHPVSGKILRLRAPVPEDFAQECRRCEIFCPS